MEGILPESVRTRTDKTIFEGVVTNEFQQQWPVYEEAFGPPGDLSLLNADTSIDVNCIRGWKSTATVTSVVISPI